MKTALAALAAMVAVGVAGTPAASAQPLCEVRSAAHVAEHGGLTEDSRWHVANGELPTCGQPEGDTERRHDDSQDTADDDQKSRYCRQHWYC